MSPAPGYAVFPTALGHAAIAWAPTARGAPGIRRFLLPADSAQAAERLIRRRLPAAIAADPPDTIAATIAAAQRYFAGERIDFAALPLDLADQPDFPARIYAALRRVPWGGTTTYGALAKQLGAGPQAARDVGIAMARNPVPLIIPCHRVLAAGGKLGGFSAPGGTATKLRMLALEGIQAGPQQAAFAL